MQNKVIRASGIELLRIILMLMIICHHMIVHAADLELMGNDTYTITPDTLYYLLINSFFVIGVNGFIFISGYYGISFKIKGLINIVIQTLFYSVILLILTKFFMPEKFGMRMLVNSLLPVSSGKWWFITAYIFLYIISPILNNAFEVLNKKQMLFIVLSFCFMINFSGFIFDPSVLGVHNGYSLNNMIFIYVLGRYINKYVNTEKIEKYGLLLYISFSLVIFMLSYIALSKFGQQLSWKVFAYDNPVLLLSAISLFFYFKRIKIQSAFINKIAISVLAVYLLHSNSLAAKYLYHNVFLLSKHSVFLIHFFLIILIAIIVFVICIIIEQIRSKLFAPLIDYLTFKADVFLGNVKA